MAFHDGDLQSGIALAIQQQMAVLCFVHADDSDKSQEWEGVLLSSPFSEHMHEQVVAIRLRAGSSEAAFLTPIAPVNSTPAVIVIKNASLQANIQAAEVTIDQLRQKLQQLIAPHGPEQSNAPSLAEQSDEVVKDATQADPSSSGPTVGYLDLPPSAGQPRLPNNAYDALREFTEGLKACGESPAKILEAQLGVLSRLPIFKEEVQRLRSLDQNDQPELSQTARDRLMLRLPAAAIKAQMKVQTSATSGQADAAPSATGRVYSQRSTAPAPAPQRPSAPQVPDPASQPELSEAQRAQQNEYRQMQRDREQKQREERERIKAQIKADREERRRREQVQKQNDEAATSPPTGGTLKPTGNEVRVQVRTFDGSVIRETFKPISTITTDLRPWIDSAIESNVPYDFKLILTPLPNKKIEASEEEMALSDLGIKHSCTFVIAPVQGYVESYSGASGGIVGSAVSGGYNLVTGTAGALFGGFRSILGYGQPAAETRPAQGSTLGESAASNQRSMRVRTLADQRAEDVGKNEFYNGNQLNFQPNKDDDRKND
ncbi:uncharacterized protein HMPREF1541_03974 [Cyphellophora europaea CBS 101466]|uniref:UBX domain-containing protein n=1 Tax=Cyphellophora europaea (strain CBS 101466) TaxID=1220924 RepID=W2S0B2_CYPE1|nr:uncharacterized protein HMPREF1541_03974 [Cyphellophora europaea CBS 101466]ETN42035.1 hypothetical protein HMPREF1541_03974 [Cyphellophora europaea CBS 101466]